MTQTPHTSPKDQGFTLVEVLISIFIFALISVGSMGALTSSLQSKERISDRLDALSELQQMRALIKADMGSVILRQNRDILGGFDPVLLSGGGDNLIEFTRGGRDNPGYLSARGDLQRVAYAFEEGALIRRTSDHENPAPQSETRDRVLLTGLQEADIIFHTDKISEERVEITMDMIQVLPDMIELRLTFENGDDLVQYFGVSL